MSLLNNFDDQMLMDLVELFLYLSSADLFLQNKCLLLQYSKLPASQLAAFFLVFLSLASLLSSSFRHFYFFLWNVRYILWLYTIYLYLKLPRRYSDDITSNIANSIFTKVDFQRAVVCLAHYLWSSKLPNAAIAICNFWYRNRRNYRVLVLLPKVGFYKSYVTNYFNHRLWKKHLVSNMYIHLPYNLYGHSWWNCKIERYNGSGFRSCLEAMCLGKHRTHMKKVCFINQSKISIIAHCHFRLSARNTQCCSEMPFLFLLTSITFFVILFFTNYRCWLFSKKKIIIFLPRRDSK